MIDERFLASRQDKLIPSDKFVNLPFFGGYDALSN
jgi:hypothetical protein